MKRWLPLVYPFGLLTWFALAFIVIRNHAGVAALIAAFSAAERISLIFCYLITFAAILLAAIRSHS